MSEDWDKPSEALRKMAEAKEPAVRAMTEAEKRAVMEGTLPTERPE